MAVRKQFVVSPEDQEMLNRIRRCEALRIQSHMRRDQLVVEARRRGITLKLIAGAMGVGTNRVSQIQNEPFKNGKKGKRKSKESDVEKSS